MQLNAFASQEMQIRDMRRLSFWVPMVFVDLVLEKNVLISVPMDMFVRLNYIVTLSVAYQSLELNAMVIVNPELFAQKGKKDKMKADCVLLVTSLVAPVMIKIIGVWVARTDF